MKSIPSIKLQYGQKIKDRSTNEIYQVDRYFKTDSNPMSYKVKVVPVNGTLRSDSYYSSDLVKLIEQGEFILMD